MVDIFPLESSLLEALNMALLSGRFCFRSLCVCSNYLHVTARFSVGSRSSNLVLPSHCILSGVAGNAEGFLITIRLPNYINQQATPCGSFLWRRHCHVSDVGLFELVQRECYSTTFDVSMHYPLSGHTPRFAPFAWRSDV